ncbi:MAG: AAA family ATPase [Thermodesulfobacteriota bacterium]|nr:AAA family ATPase [Thermodesulfobacteriota bacterium]
MSNHQLYQLWDDFLEKWPLERVRQLTLSEYTNLNRDDAYIYWLEKRLEKLGSIWGGSAFKFGIYHRDDTKPKEPTMGKIWGETYAWAKKYGSTEQEAFQTVRERIVQIIEAVQLGNLDLIDTIDFSLGLKWKLAFLYQSRENPTIFPIFKHDCLFYLYQAIDPTAKSTQTAHSLMYTSLLDQHKGLGDIFAIADELWQQWQAFKEKKPRYFAVPLAWSLDENEVDELCGLTDVSAENISDFLDKLLAESDMAAGDHFALLQEDTVRAVGQLQNAEPGDFAWQQIPVNFSVNLLPIPTSEIRELEPAEQDDIWSQVPDIEEPEQTIGPKFWKIAPGRKGIGWPEWRDNNIVSIGWPELGDISNLTKKEFDKQAAHCAKLHDYKNQGMQQVWTFHTIKPGDRVVANAGKSKILGIGTVTGGYRFSPGSHFIEDEEYPHQLQVEWDSVTPRVIPEQKHWMRSIRPVSEEDFESFLAAPEITEEQAHKPSVVTPLVKVEPCNPQNIILHGPPGTGKTYSTTERALQLILGPEKIKGMSQDTMVRHFRQLQQQGRIEFVTFHQSYGYEEFVEGIRPVLDEQAGNEVHYELHKGVFKAIALKAAAEGIRNKAEIASFDLLWKQLLSDIASEENRVVESITAKQYLLSVTSRKNVQIHACEVDAEGNVSQIDGHVGQTASQDNVKLIWQHRQELGPEPDQITMDKTQKLFAREMGGGGGHHYTAIWIAYKELYQISRTSMRPSRQELPSELMVQEALDKPSAGLVEFSFSNVSPQYVLIIDEINRGNISKILGELITLLEPDKRLSHASELKLPLSYSPEHRFAVPPNLHVIGTMNTADRSIALMDVALRRRFTFEELLPDKFIISRVLEQKKAGPYFTDLVVEIFETINSRIRFLYDQDHQLGHAYFLDAVDYESLCLIFVDRIIPLLQEYFYGAWDKICMVLGCPYDESGSPQRRGPIYEAGKYKQPIIEAKVFAESDTLGFDHDEYEDRVDYKLAGYFIRPVADAKTLIPYLLGILNIGDQEEYDQHVAQLTSEAAGSKESEAG